MADKPTVMISSTARDLPDHRKEVMDACIRQDMFPTMMEHLPAQDKEAIEVSLNMVDKADIYIGIFAHRYGYIPNYNNPDQISITEMEYNRAIERGIPRFLFFMHGDHPVKAADIEKGIGGEKLDQWKESLGIDRVANFFKNPEDLRAHVINSLSTYKQEGAKEEAKNLELPEPAADPFHYVSDIPEPPEKYVAHPYTLLQTHGLVGRQAELNLLTEWVAKQDSDIYKAHILSIVAIGGMGKSALTWKWFEDIAPEEMEPLAGRMWWSFYESDASFENFIIRALAYVSKRSIEDVQGIHSKDRETQLLSILDKEPFLLVLDGLERILIAYARMDAAYLLSDSDYDRATANFVANAYGMPLGAAQSFTGEHLVRKTADPRAGAFLRKLSAVRTAKILMSTRLYPFDLQRIDGVPVPGCHAVFLRGLLNDDALNLWRSFGVSGSRSQLLPVFDSFGNHALLVQALASEIANFRSAPRDFEKWRNVNPGFDPAKYPQLKDAMVHVLEYALRGLGNGERNVLQTIAGFRMPTSYDTLASVLIGEGKPCRNAGELDAALAGLEDRGLVGWDKRANRHDLHPIVRGVVWEGLGNDARQGVYASLHSHFEAVPMIENYLEVNSLEDLTPAIELYNTQIGMGLYDEAARFFSERLDSATLYRLSASRQRVEMLERLFRDGVDELPHLSNQEWRAYVLNSLAQGYQLSGQPSRAVPLYRTHNTIRLETAEDTDLGKGLENLSDTLFATGNLFESEAAARRALEIARKHDDHSQEAIGLRWLGLALAARRKLRESRSALRRSLVMFIEQRASQGQGVTNASLAQRALWCRHIDDALFFANRSSDLAIIDKGEADIIRSARLQGEAAMELGHRLIADERLHYALIRARAVNLVEDELPSLVALAELYRRLGEEKAARDFLDDIWEFAERGPYPLVHADALNVLAQIERENGNTDKAIEAAGKAYQLAWCDGPPYAYHWGLIKARKHLEELGAPVPNLPPFDEFKVGRRPEVEIDPDDEFHIGTSEESS